MENILLVIHVLVAISLVGVVLLQRSEGGALGIGGGGGGGGGGLFSSRGAANVLTRATAVLAAVFFLTSIALTVVHSGGPSASILDRMGPVSTDAPRDSDSAPAASDDAAPAVPAPVGEPVVPRPE